MQSAGPSNSEMPKTLGAFRLLRLLGEGGMGTVYLGERTEQFTQQVAIKIFHPQLFPESADASVQREAKLLAALDHPGIVHMLDLGVSSANLRYLVMEYVDGLPLDAFCDQQNLSIKHRIGILIDICDAVEYAHRHFVIHADLKPENILVTAEGKPRLLDFGVATVVSEMGADLSASASFTPLYASPEQHAGERLTVASDLYSLGVVAQSLLSGALPKSASMNHAITLSSSKMYTNLPSESQTKIASSRSTTAAQLASMVRGDVDAILAKATQPEPAQRFQSAQELSDEFRRFLAGHPIRTRPASVGIRTRKWIRRNQLVSGLTGILLLALMLSAIGVIWRTREATQRRQIAVTRLHELVRLTDVLAGELYDSVHSLPASEAAQQALLDSAHQTIDKLATTLEDDPQLELELAREYAKLAHIELARTPLNKAELSQATEDIGKADKLTQRLPQNNPEVIRIAQELSQLKQLSLSAAPHSEK